MKPTAIAKTFRIAALLSITCAWVSTAKADTIPVTYSFFNGAVTQPPIPSGNTLILDFASDGSFLSNDPSLNALWNPLRYHDHSVLDLTTKLLNGVFDVTFADGNTLHGKLFEDLTKVDITTVTGPFTQTLTFTGGTGEFAGATGSFSGEGLGGVGVSGTGTINAPAIPEPAPAGLLLGGLAVLILIRWSAAATDK